jgi:hypothetical protein
MRDPEYGGDCSEIAVCRSEVGISLPGGDALPALVCEPALVPAAAVLIVHDANGRTPFYEALARRVAVAGFVALLPDLYFRVDPDVKRDPVAAAQLDYQQTIQALQASVDWLRTQRYVAGHRLGTVGFSLGGTLVLDLAAERKDLATATFNGFPNGRLAGGPTIATLRARRLCRSHGSMSVNMVVEHGCRTRFIRPASAARIRALSCGRRNAATTFVVPSHLH